MVLKIHRLAHWLHAKKVPLLPHLLKIATRVVFAAVIPPQTRIGKNVVLGYQGLGTILHRNAVIEDLVIVGAGVTIGGRSGHAQVPVVCEGAMIGAGAKILGPVRVGRYSSIGANAVVLSDIPDFGVAVGIPAKTIRINSPADMPDYHHFAAK